MKRFNLITVFLLSAILGCNLHKAQQIRAKASEDKVYAKEPDDGASYRLLKYDFYLSRAGQLCERKLALARDSNCNCEFEVYYDSAFSIYTGDSLVRKPLGTILDVNSFVLVDSTDFSKDKNHVFYFYGNSDGGNRVIVEKADPLTFKRLCEYRWGIDRNYVFYQNDVLPGLDLKHLRVLYPPDTSNHFVEYIRDGKIVYFENRVVKGADANSFKVVSGQKWDAEDRYRKYYDGSRLE